MSQNRSTKDSAPARILEHHFGKRPTRIKRLTGGLNNHVFEGRIGRDDFIVRISDDAAKLQTFIKEQWAVRQARRVRVPTAEILEVGNTVINKPYMISTKVEGIDATRWPQRLETAREMGCYAAKINTIPTHGYGLVFDWSRNTLSKNKSWKEFLDDELKIDERVDLLASRRLMKTNDLKKLRHNIGELRQWRGRPALTHGDIRFKNVVLDEAGKIRAILDWENCTSNRAPQWELSIALHDLCVDEKENFLQGYGMSPREYGRISAAIKTLNILNYSVAIESAIAEKNRRRLEELRARLNGAFDLHSL
jgi:aminoglycoside phosphotransferase (APT) family kinase protein